MTLDQQIEHHLTNKRFDEAFALINQNQLQMSKQNTPLILKAQNT
jgi:hypothetical protein